MFAYSQRVFYSASGQEVASGLSCVVSQDICQWAIYVDGKEEKTGTFPFRAMAEFTFNLGSGSSSFGSNKLLLSQWNVWDRVLTSQEISQLPEKCNAGVGNVGSWADIYYVPKWLTGLYSKPSTRNVENPKLAEDLQTNSKSRDRFFRKRPKKN